MGYMLYIQTALYAYTVGDNPSSLWCIFAADRDDNIDICDMRFTWCQLVSIRWHLINLTINWDLETVLEGNTLHLNWSYRVVQNIDFS
jgi:hypothetical protein